MSAFGALLGAASAERRAVGAFTCYGLEAASACLDVARDRGAPAILLVSPGSYAAPGGDALLATLLAVSRAAEPSTALLVQLDHATDLRLIERALAAGAGAVMADGSRLPFAENVAFTARAVELAAAHGAGVEAELGHVAGDEDVAEARAAGAFTDPDDAARFVAATGVACLAVSIGNVHGRYRRAPQLDWALLERIRRRVDVPLSLHGASGLGDADVRRAIDLGVAKVNVNTELRQAYFDALGTLLPETQPGFDLARLVTGTTAAVRTVVTAKQALFTTGGAGK